MKFSDTCCNSAVFGDWGSEFTDIFRQSSGNCCTFVTAVFPCHPQAKTSSHIGWPRPNPDQQRASSLGYEAWKRRTFNRNIFLIIVKWWKVGKSFHDYQKYIQLKCATLFKHRTLNLTLVKVNPFYISLWGSYRAHLCACMGNAHQNENKECWHNFDRINSKN